jgi:hypothetical protein
MQETTSTSCVHIKRLVVSFIEAESEVEERY